MDNFAFSIDKDGATPIVERTKSKAGSQEGWKVDYTQGKINTHKKKNIKSNNRRELTVHQKWYAPVTPNLRIRFDELPKLLTKLNAALAHMQKYGCHEVNFVGTKRDIRFNSEQVQSR